MKIYSRGGICAVSIFQDEIPIAAEFFRVIQLDMRQRRAFVADSRFVRRTRHFLHRQPGRQRDRHAECAGRGCAFRRIWVADPLRGNGRGGFRLIGIARTHDRRIHEFIHAVRRHKQFRVAHFDLDFIAGQNVRHVHLEHIRTLLLQQRRAFPDAPGFFVFLPRLCALFDLRDNRAVADGHFHAINRRARGRGKDVNRLDSAFARVRVNLRDLDIRNHARDADGNIGRFQRQTIRRRIVALNEKVGGQGFFGLLFHKLPRLFESIFRSAKS